MKLLKYYILIFIFSISNLSIQGQSNNSVGPLIQNDWTNFTWPYNAYFPESSSGVNGHVGNACGHTVIARILYYYGFPVNGNEVLDFTDRTGTEWYCDLTNMNLNFTDMPYQLDWDATQEEYNETAKLFLAASAVGAKIEVGYKEGLANLPETMIQYFNYSPYCWVVNRWDYSKETWIEIFKEELDNERPIIVVGRTPDSPAPWEPGGWQGHWWICDGYNENDEFYINYSFGGIKGYYDIDNLGEIYTAYNMAIIGLEPNYNGKSISINSTTAGSYPNDKDIEISWTSTNISYFSLELSLDDGKNWQLIEESISAANQNYAWMPNGETSSECYFKLVDAEDENIYKVSQKFSLTDKTTLINDEASILPKEFSLKQNFPNPFNPSTIIKFTIGTSPYPSAHLNNGMRAGAVLLRVYNVLGEEVVTLVNKKLNPGNYSVEFDGSQLPSGMYIYKLTCEGIYTATKKLLLIK